MTTSTPRRFVLVPLTSEESHHMIVEASLAGKPARFILDSGAGATVLDLAAVTRYRLRLLRGSREGVGVGSGTTPIRYVGGKHRLRLGAANLSGMRLQAIDLSVVNETRKRKKKAPVAGIIGADVLRSRQAVIDYGRQVLLVAD